MERRVRFIAGRAGAVLGFATVLGVGLVGVGLVGVGLGGCAASNRVTMDEMHGQIGKLTGLEGDPLEKEKVEYMTTGKGNYDEFFKSAAQLRAGIIVSRALVETLTLNLKKYARSYAAAKAADENIKGIVGQSKLDDLSDDQSFALLNLKKKQGELGGDEKTFATRSVVNAAETADYLVKAGDQAKTLVDSGTALTKSVPNDFTGLEAAKAPSVTKSLGGALDNVKEAAAKGPDLAKTLARLGEGLKSLL